MDLLGKAVEERSCDELGVIMVDILAAFLNDGEVGLFGESRVFVDNFLLLL